MQRIVPAILTFEQHRDALERAPVIYRPSACPHCGLAKPWGHGCYARKADRRPQTSCSLNPIAIPRFFCRGCGQTCSRLPECLAPRRWYGWAVQQVVLMWLLGGGSLHQAAGQGGVDRHTVRRWWGWLRDRSETFSFWLRSRFPELGRAVDRGEFWPLCWQVMPLSGAMAWLDRDGVAVP
jgi:transposase-like protein